MERLSNNQREIARALQQAVNGPRAIQQAPAQTVGIPGGMGNQVLPPPPPVGEPARY